MTPLSKEEQADLDALEAEVQRAPLVPPGKDVRVDRYVGEAPGLADDGTFFPVPGEAQADDEEE